MGEVRTQVRLFNNADANAAAELAAAQAECGDYQQAVVTAAKARAGAAAGNLNAAAQYDELRAQFSGGKPYRQ